MSVTLDTLILRAHFLQEWGTETPIVSSGDPVADQPSAEYVRITILPNTETRKTLGAGAIYERKGIVWIDIFTPATQPDGRALELIDRASAIFRDWKHVSTVELRCATVEHRSGETENGFRKSIVTIPYHSR